MHYRDLNLGSILLHPDWRAKVEKDGDAQILLLVDFGNPRVGNSPSTCAGAAGPADPLALGLEDAQSVNRTFMSSKAASRLAGERRLRALRRSPETGDEEFLSLLYEELSKTDHRYPDDLESATYCFLMGLLLRVKGNYALARELEVKVIQPILGEGKSTTWSTPVGFVAALAETRRIRDSPLTEGVRKMLQKVHGHVLDAQREAREASGERPWGLTDRERAAFRKVLETLDEYIAGDAHSLEGDASDGVRRRTPCRK